VTPNNLRKGKTMGKNPLDGFRVKKSDISFIGKDLKTPECVFCRERWDKLVSDGRGGIVKLLPDGSQTFIRQTKATIFGKKGPEMEKSIPNGMAFAENGDILVANYGTSQFEITRRNGETRVIYDSIDGRRLGEVNFIYRDSQRRLWFTIATMKTNWMDGMYPEGADGYVGMIDDKGLRKLADGFCYTNEVRLDKKENTCRSRQEGCISRLQVQPDRSLKNREIFGPQTQPRGSDGSLSIITAISGEPAFGKMTP
jgi:hypothetical protein